MAALADPGGADFDVWQPTALKGLEATSEGGALCWFPKGSCRSVTTSVDNLADGEQAGEVGARCRGGDGDVALGVKVE